MATPWSIRTAQRVLHSTCSVRPATYYIPLCPTSWLSPPNSLKVAPVVFKRHAVRYVGKLGKFNPVARHMENEYSEYTSRGDVYMAASEKYLSDLNRLFRETPWSVSDGHYQMPREWELDIMFTMTSAGDVARQMSKLDIARRIQRHGPEVLTQKELARYTKWSPIFKLMCHAFAAQSDEVLRGWSCALLKEYLTYAINLTLKTPKIKDPKLVNLYLALATYHADVAVLLGSLEAALILDRWEKTPYAQLRDVRHANFAAARELIKTQAKDRTTMDLLKRHAVVAHTEYVCRNGYMRTSSDLLQQCLESCLSVSELDQDPGQSAPSIARLADHLRGANWHSWSSFDQPEKKALQILNFGIKRDCAQSPQEVDKLKSSLTKILINRYNDPDTLFNTVLQSEQNGIPVSDSFWHRAVSAAAADGSSDACWLLAKYHLEADGFLPFTVPPTHNTTTSGSEKPDTGDHKKVKVKTKKSLATSLGASYAEVAIHLTPTSSPTRFSNRAVALAALYLMQPKHSSSFPSFLSWIPQLLDRDFISDNSAHQGLLLLNRLETTASTAFSPTVARSFEVFCNDYTSVKGTFGIGSDAAKRRIQLINRVWGYVNDPSVKVRVGRVPARQTRIDWFKQLIWG